jgi:predicted nucleic acid-binding protein
VIAYLDTSVILRVILSQPNRLEEWLTITTGVCSVLAELECLRTLDRLRLEQAFPEEIIRIRREAVALVMRSAEVIGLTQSVLERASRPLPSALGTLDAIHLATATLWQETIGAPLVVATHDRALARAARSMGLGVVGVGEEELG